jgi:hypothetical protein
VYSAHRDVPCLWLIVKPSSSFFVSTCVAYCHRLYTKSELVLVRYVLIMFWNYYLFFVTSAKCFLDDSYL